MRKLELGFIRLARFNEVSLPQPPGPPPRPKRPLIQPVAPHGLLIMDDLLSQLAAVGPYP